MPSYGPMCPVWRCMLAAICDVIKMAGGHTRGRKEQEKWYFTHSSHVVCDWNLQQATQCRGINSASVSYLSALLLTVTYEIRSEKSWITLDLLQRVVSSCCQQPSYTIFPRSVGIVNTTYHTSGPGKASSRLTTSIVCWTASHWHLSIGWISVLPYP